MELIHKGGRYLRRTAFAKATGCSSKRPSQVESCRSRRLDTWLLRRTCGIASTFCARASCVMPIRRWRLRMRRSGVSKGSGSDTNAWTGLDWLRGRGGDSASTILVAGAEIFPSKVCCVPLRGSRSKAGPCETNVQLAGGDMQAIVS